MSTQPGRSSEQNAAPGASRRTVLRTLGSATVALVGVQAVDVPGLVGEQTLRAAQAQPLIASPPGVGPDSLAPVDASTPAALAPDTSLAAPGLPAYPAPWPGQTALDSLTFDQFQQHLASTFRVHHADGVQEMVLTAVAASTAEPDRLQDNFAIMLHGTATVPLDQGTYKLEHPSLGAFDLFLVPVGKAPAHQAYEAIFSRLPAAAL
jgi:hypothetical protein